MTPESPPPAAWQESWQEYRDFLNGAQSIRNRRLPEIEAARQFNIFLVLRKTYDEVGLHSAFLCELLNPHGTHKMGSEFLRLFLDACLMSDHGLDPDSCTVDKEHRNIDILIRDRTAKKAVVIENKIYAGDQGRQLERYVNSMKNAGYETTPVYLTLYGHKPSEESRGCVEEEDIRLLSYRKEILEWLEKCREAASQNPAPRLESAISQYMDVLKELTGQDTPMQYIEELKDYVKNYAQSNGVALLEDLGTAYSKLKDDLRKEFLESLGTRFDEEFKTIPVEPLKIVKPLDKNSFIRSYKLGTIGPGHALVLEVGAEPWRIYFGYVIWDETNSTYPTLSEYPSCVAALKHMYGYRHSQGYICWKWSEHDIDLGDFISAAEKLFDKDLCNESLQEIAGEIVEDTKAVLAEFTENSPDGFKPVRR